MKNYIIYLFLVFLILLFYVWQQIQVTRLGYKIELMRKESAHYDNENRYLQIKIGELTSLEHIEHFARERLQMKPADKNAIIILPEP